MGGPADIATPSLCAGHAQGVTSIAFVGQDKGCKLVTAGADRMLVARNLSADGASSDERSLEGVHGGFHSLACNPAGNQAAVCDDQYVRLYSLPSLEEVGVASRFQLPVRSVSYSADGATLAAAGDDGMVKIISAADQKVLKQFRWEGCVRSVALDPHGDLVAAVQADGMLAVWDVKEGKQVLKRKLAPRVDPSGPVRLGLDWHMDGSLLAVPGQENDVLLLERLAWKKAGCLAEAHSAAVNCVAFSPNSLYVATAGRDGLLCIWLVEGNKCVARCELGAVASSIAWHAADNLVAAATEGGAVGLIPGPVPAGLPSPWMSEEELQRQADAEAAGKQGAKRLAGADAADGEDVQDSDDLADSFIVDEEQVARRAAARKRRKVVLEATAAALMPRINLAQLAPRPQEPFQPGATPSADAAAGAAEGAGRGAARFLALDLLGAIISRDMGSHNSIEVQFHDVTVMRKRVPLLTDYFGFFAGALSSRGALYASAASDDTPSMLVYRPFDGWAANSDWSVALPPGEQATCIACGQTFAAAATSAGLLRIYSLAGTQVYVMSLPAPALALAAHDHLLALVHHAPGGPELRDGSQCLQYAVYDVSAQALAHSGALPLGRSATLAWLGFSAQGVLAAQDSAGVLRVRAAEFGGCWSPVFSSEAQRQSPAEAFWLVGLSGDSAYCIVTSTTQPYPQPSPKPVMQALPLQVPVAPAEGSAALLESDLLRACMQLSQLRQRADLAAAGGALELELAGLEDALAACQTEADRCCLKLLQVALKADRQARALELAAQLHHYKSLQGALQLVNFHRKPALAERVSLLLQERLQMEAELGALEQDGTAAAEAAAAGGGPAGLRPSLPRQLSYGTSNHGAGEEDAMQEQEQEQQEAGPAAAQETAVAAAAGKRPEAAVAAKAPPAAKLGAAAFGGSSKAAAGSSNPFARKPKSAKC